MNFRPSHLVAKLEDATIRGATRVATKLEAAKQRRLDRKAREFLIIRERAEQLARSR